MNLFRKKISIGAEELAYIEEGKGEAVILLHGNLSSSVHFQPLLERLKDDYRCVAPDLRGFGESSYNRRFDSLDELAEDVCMFMEQLGIPAAFVAGWSTGGGIAMKLAAMHPEKVRKLFIMEGVGYRGYPTYMKSPDGKSTGEAYADKEAMAADPQQVGRLLKILSDGNEEAMSKIWQGLIYTVSKPEPDQNALWIRETLKQRNLADLEWALAAFNMSEQDNPYGQGDGSIRNITCQAAFTSGDRDRVVPVSMVESNVKALKPLSTLIRYENCGHSPLVDCPGRLAEDIRFFFSKSE